MLVVRVHLHALVLSRLQGKSCWLSPSGCTSYAAEGVILSFAQLVPIRMTASYNERVHMAAVFALFAISGATVSIKQHVSGA